MRFGKSDNFATAFNLVAMTKTCYVILTKLVYDNEGCLRGKGFSYSFILIPYAEDEGEYQVIKYPFHA